MNMNTIQTEETTEDKHVIKTVSMYPEQWAMVDEINERYGFRNTSSALRFILNDYRRLTTEQ